MSLLYDMKPADVISPAYLALQKELHARPQGYGGKGGKWAPAVEDLALQIGATSVLDFGCGEGALAKALRARGVVFRADEYDPAIPGKDSWPGFADLVVCTDVLEHVEPDRLSTVLALIKTLARKAVFLVVALDPANKTLADGRNAHLIQESPEWWEARVTEAGFLVTPPNEAALPCHYTPEKRSKRWIAVAVPC